MIEQLITGVFLDNLALTFFLGMCTYLAVSDRVSTSLGLGIAIVVVLTLTTPLNSLLYRYLLKEGALTWAGYESLNLEHLSLICFIAVIAASVQILEMILERFVPVLYQSLGIYLPLITVNCAILGSSLFMMQKRLTVVESVSYGFFNGLGWMLAVVLFASIRERLHYSKIPGSLQGLGAAFIVAGLLSMSFSTFSEISQP